MVPTPRCASELTPGELRAWRAGYAAWVVGSLVLLVAVGFIVTGAGLGWNWVCLGGVVASATGTLVQGAVLERDRRRWYAGLAARLDRDRATDRTADRTDPPGSYRDRPAAWPIADRDRPESRTD